MLCGPQITIFSLYAGISIGLTCDDMLHNLEKFSKNYIPEDLVEQIQKVASAFGKVCYIADWQSGVVDHHHEEEEEDSLFCRRSSIPSFS